MRQQIAWVVGGTLGLAGGVGFLVAFGVYTGISEEAVPAWTAAALAVGSALGVIAGITSIAMGWWFSHQSMTAQGDALRMELRMRTLEYLQAQLANPAISAARMWMKEAKDRIHAGEEVDVQAEAPPEVIEICDLCNHLAGGLETGALSRSVMATLLPFDGPNSWFVNNWNLLQPYVEGIRHRIGEAPYPSWERLVTRATS